MVREAKSSFRKKIVPNTVVATTKFYLLRCSKIISPHINSNEWETPGSNAFLFILGSAALLVYHNGLIPICRSFRSLESDHFVGQGPTGGKAEELRRAKGHGAFTPDGQRESPLPCTERVSRRCGSLTRSKAHAEAPCMLDFYRHTILKFTPCP